MKFIFLNLNSAKENWSEAATLLYKKKLEHFVDFELVGLKIENLNRSQKEIRVQKEAKVILEYLKPQDYLILFDENGKSLNSIEFSKKINLLLNSGKKRVIFLIGGPFGVAEEIKQRADLKISLSMMTFNHLVALTVALEQIYRAFSILNNLPYHNN